MTRIWGNGTIVLDSTSAEYDSTTLHVTTISPQNAWLRDNQDIVYSIDNTDDGDQFEIDGNALKFKSTPEDTQDSYALTILSSGDFGQSNSRAVAITVTEIQSSIPLNIDAGDDQTVREGVTVTLNGIAIDAGSGTLTYSWSHNSALNMEFDPALPSITFEAPQVDSETTVTFTLEVSDDAQTVTDTVQVTIQDVTSDSDFVTTWETVTPGESVTIPARGTYTIDWGDGTIEEDANGSQTHTYDSAGDHTVRISGDITEIRLDGHVDAHKLMSIDRWGDSQWTSMYSAFRGASNMTHNAADVPDLSRVTNMRHMFDGASSFDGDLSAWDVSNVSDMSYMFKDAPLFNSDISAWDVSSVNDMSYMFNDATSFNSDISAWDVSNVNDMGRIFDGASSFDGDLSAWDVSSVNDMSYMFNDATSFNSDISAWDVSSVNDMSYMFNDATSFNSDISAWDVSNVNDMGRIFDGASSFDGDLSAWDVSSVNDMSYMFNDATSFNSDISAWDVSNVNDMGRIFDGASSFDGDLSAWDVSSVNDMSYMFKDAPLFNSDISAWDVSNVNDISGMFWHSYSFDGDVSNWDVSRVITMYGMFASARSFDGDVSNWDVSRVTDMANMFNRASSFNGDVSNWDVSRVTTMYAMFAGAIAFGGDVSNWDVSRVTDMADMFRSTSFFNSDISGWNISDTTRIDTMLYRANAFDQNLGPWYIVLDDDAISNSDVPGAVGNISTRNPHLDSQNPEYGIGSGGDLDYFEINGNVLTMLSVPDGHARPYTVNITSTGDYGTDNSRTYEIAVISSDIVSLNSTADPEPDTVVDTQVDPKLVDPEPVDPEPVETSQNSADFSESELQTLREWNGSPEHVGDDKFLNVFGIEGTTVPNYLKSTTQWFIDGALSKQELINALTYLQDQELLK